jgi:hypothetical protein
MGVSIPAEALRDLAVVMLTAGKLRGRPTEYDQVLAARLSILGEEMLQKAIDEGLDTELLLDDLPEHLEPGPEGLEPGNGEEVLDEELTEELEHLECEECLENQGGPQGMPQENLAVPSIPVTPQPSLSGAVVTDDKVGERPKPAKKVKKSTGPRKYLACTTPRLVRASGGRKAWMSFCAYTQGASRRTRVLAKIVSNNPAFRPRSLHMSGRKVPFVTEAELDKLLAKDAE